MSTNNAHKSSGNLLLGSKNHHPQQHLPHSVPAVSASVATSGAAAASSHLHHPQHQQQQHQLQLPPRYQPPPQPPGGILKGLQPVGKSVDTAPTHPPPPPPHLNIKYPPDVPKLASVYIPEALRGAIPTVGAPKLSLAQRQLHQRHSATTTTTGDQPTGHHLVGTRNAVGSGFHPAQHVEMLKFVRKPEATDGGPAGNGTVSNSAGNAQHINGHLHNSGLNAAMQQQHAATNGSNNHNNNNNHMNNNNGSSSNGAARMSAEQSRHLQQSMLAEMRSLKEANQRLSDDNQELRDLCCFLDDDRQKGRKLAREWQRFGRYTASVMRQEVSAYQNKLRQLDDKQQELIRDNLELKELCLYLDEERANVAAAQMATTVCGHCGVAVRPTMRDDGDGSSSSTNADEPMPSVRQFERPIPELNIRPTLSDQTLQYVRSLERKIRQLEQQETASSAAAAAVVAATAAAATAAAASSSSAGSGDSSSTTVVGRPEAVVRALQILEVREQLERDRSTAGGGVGAEAGAALGGGGGGVGGGSGGLNGVGGGGGGATEHMDDGEKALVREMCNVVWRKLEDNPNGPGLDPM